MSHSTTTTADVKFDPTPEDRAVVDSEMAHRYPVTLDDDPGGLADLLERYPSDDPGDADWIRTLRNRDLQRRFKGLGDLLQSIAGHLRSLGLEPTVQGDSVDVLFLGHTIELRATDLDRMAEHMLAEWADNRAATPEEMAMIAAGMAIG